MDTRLRDPCAELENTNILDGRSSPKEDSLFGAITDSTVTFHSLYITSIPQSHTSGSEPGMPRSTGGKWGKAVDSSFGLPEDPFCGSIEPVCPTFSFTGNIWEVAFELCRSSSLCSTSRAQREGSNSWKKCKIRWLLPIGNLLPHRKRGNQRCLNGSRYI